MENIAVITAGGIGSRTSQSIPKQFISIYDKPIIIYTLEAFQKHSEIDSIVIACLEGWEDYLKTYANQYGITKLKKIAIGGKTNFDSIRIGLNSAKEFCSPDDIVLVHDGNRPFVSGEIISNCIKSAKELGNAVTYIPTTEVVFMQRNNENPVLLDRDKLIRTQTPHAARLDFMSSIFDRAVKENVSEKSAFCSLLSQFDYTIHFVEGDAKNFKITYKEDLELFKGLVSLEKD